MDGLKVYTVSEVTRYIRALLEGEEGLSGIWVEGEISNLNHHTSGHIYFSLKDDNARLQCVMFKTWNAGLKFRLDNGLKVFAYGSIGLYEKGGIYQLYVERIEPAGLGSLYLAFEQLRLKLEKEGLFGPSRKRRLPRFPRRIGLVTSPTGAAVRDIITILKRRFPSVEVLLAPALVQGDDAPESIVAAIELINMYSVYNPIDVLIVGRGGGAAEELWAFNDERVARAIARSRIPVVSAVGHETDFTIADFVADVRAPTPSAAAEIVVPDRMEVLRMLASLHVRMFGALEHALEARKKALSSLREARLFKFPLEQIRQLRQELDECQKMLKTLVSHEIALKREAIRSISGKMHVLSPLATLARGYSICRILPRREIVKSKAQVYAGANLEVLVTDGRFSCEVNEIGEGEPEL